MGRAKTKHNRLKNISLILKELLRNSKQGGSTLEDLVDLCGVSTRNIYRYLKEIEALGFQLIRPPQLKSANKGKGRYQLSAKTLQFSQVDIGLVLILCLYAQKEKQYLEQFNLIYEVFVKNLAVKHGLFYKKY